MTSGLRFFRRWALILSAGWAALLLLLLAAGLAYQSAATCLDQRKYPMPGRLVAVDGYNLHLHCIGSGAPTVVLDAGLGDSSITWALVQPEVAAFTHVCSYDRPGYGWSGEASVPRDSEHAARQLHQLLASAGIDAPYILAGHSFGGLNQLVFQSLYPHEVVGLVLVDSSHPDQINRLPASYSIEAYEQSIRFRPLGARFGLGRLLGWCRDDYTFPGVGPAWQRTAPEAIALDCRTAAFRASYAEGLAFRQSAQEAKSVSSLGSMPLVVLSHDPEIGSGFPAQRDVQLERAWNQMQEELRGLSTNSRRIIAIGSMHYVECYRPELVIAAVREVYDSAESGRSLAAATTRE
jgi:pimeloyl-ACP methyl ester carboxylesterase